MSEPTPRKPSKRPAVSTIGSPAMEIQRGPRGVFNSISSALNGCLSSSTRPSSAWPPRSAGSEWPRSCAGRLAEQGRHSRADVGDSIFAIDRPQPANAALFIFLEQQACAFALAADVGIHLELLERPARDGENAEDRDPHRKHDREHMMERDGVASHQQRGDDSAGEGDEPGGRARRHDDEAERTDAEPGNDRSGNHLGPRIERRKRIERNAEPDRSAHQRRR